jgi:hypothetical protein
MTASTRGLMVVLFAWVLWVDQSVYTLPGEPGDSRPRQVEGASSRWQQLGVTETRRECRELKRAYVQEARRRDDEDDRRSRPPGGKYREQYRYFCSPAGGEPGQ